MDRLSETQLQDYQMAAQKAASFGPKTVIIGATDLLELLRSYRGTAGLKDLLESTQEQLVDTEYQLRDLRLEVAGLEREIEDLREELVESAWGVKP